MSVERSQDLLQPAPRAGARRRLGDDDDREPFLDPGERRLAAAIRERRTDPFALVGWLHGTAPLERTAVRILVLRELGLERGARVLSQAFGTHAQIAQRETQAALRSTPARSSDVASLDAEAGRAHTIAQSVVRLLADRDPQVPSDALALIESLEPALRPLVGAELKRHRLAASGATAEEALARRTNGHAATVLAGHALPAGVRFPVRGPLGRREGTISRWLDREAERPRPAVGGRLEAALDRGGRTLGRLAQRVVGDALGKSAVTELRAFADAAADKLTRPAPARAVALDRNVSGQGLRRDDEQVLARADGDRLPLELEERLGKLLGHDFSHVRIHTDDAAATTAERLGANALTVGSHVFFNRGAYRPGTAAGDRLLVHELTHVVQHDEGRLARPGSGFHVTSPSDHVEREAKAAESKAGGLAGVPVAAPHAAAPKAAAPKVTAPKIAQPRAPELGESVAGDWKENLSSAWSSTTGAVSSGAEWAGHKVVQGAQAAGDLAEGAAESLFESIAPAWMVAFVKDPAGYIVAKLRPLIESGMQAITARFSGVINLGKSLLELASAFETAFEVLGSTGSKQQACCEEFAAALNTIKAFASKLMNNPVTAAVKSGFQALDTAITWLVRVLGGAVFDFFKEAIPSVWAEVQSFQDSINSVINQLGKAKDWLLGKLAGLGLDLRGGSGGLLDWVGKQIQPLWTEIKQAFSLDNLKKAALAIAVVSGLAPVLYIWSKLPELVTGVEQLVEVWQHRNDPAFLKNAANAGGLKAKLAAMFSPGGLVEQITNGLKQAGEFLQRAFGALEAAVAPLVASFEKSSLGKALAPIFEKLEGWVKSTIEWGQKSIPAAFTKLKGAATSAWHLAEPYVEVLANIATVIAFPPGLAAFVAGAAWQSLEPCLKGPIVDLLLDAAIGFFSAIPDLVILGPLSQLMRRGFLGFLTKVRSNPNRVALFDGIAKALTSPATAAVAFVTGFLKGVVDNVLFPFQAIMGAFKAIVWIGQLLDQLGKQATGATSTSGKQVDAAGARGQSVEHVAAEGAHAPAQAPQGADAANAGAEHAPEGAGASDPLAFLAGLGPQLMQKARALKASLDAFLDATKGGLVSAVQDAFKSQGPSMSFGDIMSGFGAMWGKVLDKVESMTGEIADKLVAAFSGDGLTQAIATVANWVGYIVGTVVFQVVIDTITVGTYAFIGPVVAFIAKVINWPAAALGPVFKMIGKLGALLPAFAKEAGGSLAKGGFHFLEKVLGPLDEFGKSIVGTADDLAKMWSKAGQKESANVAESFGVKSGLVRRTAKVATGEGSMVAHKAEQVGVNLGEKEGAETAGHTAEKTGGGAGDKAAAPTASEDAVAPAKDAVAPAKDAGAVTPEPAAKAPAPATAGKHGPATDQAAAAARKETKALPQLGATQEAEAVDSGVKATAIEPAAPVAEPAPVADAKVDPAADPRLQNLEHVGEGATATVSGNEKYVLKDVKSQFNWESAPHTNAESAEFAENTVSEINKLRDGLGDVIPETFTTAPGKFAQERVGGLSFDELQAKYPDAAAKAKVDIYGEGGTSDSTGGLIGRARKITPATDNRSFRLDVSLENFKFIVDEHGSVQRIVWFDPVMPPVETGAGAFARVAAKAAPAGDAVELHTLASVSRHDPELDSRALLDALDDGSAGLAVLHDGRIVSMSESVPKEDIAHVIEAGSEQADSLYFGVRVEGWLKDLKAAHVADPGKALTELKLGNVEKYEQYFSGKNLEGFRAWRSLDSGRELSLDEAREVLIEETASIFREAAPDALHGAEKAGAVAEHPVEPAAASEANAAEPTVAEAASNDSASELVGSFEGKSKVGSCKVTCDDLQKDIFMRTGERVNVYGVMPSTHFHVRTADGTIIDPTIMQFFNVPQDAVGEIFTGNEQQLLDFIEKNRVKYGFRKPQFESCPSSQTLFDTAWKPATVFQDGRGLVRIEAEDEEDEAFALFDRTKVPKEAPTAPAPAAKPVAEDTPPPSPPTPAPAAKVADPLAEKQAQYESQAAMQRDAGSNVEVGRSSQPYDGEGRASGDFARTFRDGNQLHIVAGDIAGHGAEAAPDALAMHQMLDGDLKNTVRDKGLAGVSDHFDALNDTRGSDMLMASMSHVSIDTETGLLRAETAGDGITLVLKADGTVHELEAAGPAMGAGFFPKDEALTHQLQPGDQLITMSDGVYERFATETSTGAGAVKDILQKQKPQSVEETLALLRSPDGRVLTDDTTVHVFRWKGAEAQGSAAFDTAGKQVLGEGATSAVYRDGGQVVKVVKDRVAADGGDLVSITAEERVWLAETTAGLANDLHEAMPGIVPAMETPAPGQIRQAFVEGKSLVELKGPAQKAARENIKKAMSQAYETLGLDQGGYGSFENGWLGKVDSNTANFRFDAEGNITSWFDPVSVVPPRERALAELGGVGKKSGEKAAGGAAKPALELPSDPRLATIVQAQHSETVGRTPQITSKTAEILRTLPPDARVSVECADLGYHGKDMSVDEVIDTLRKKVDSLSVVGVSPAAEGALPAIPTTVHIDPELALMLKDSSAEHLIDVRIEYASGQVAQMSGNLEMVTEALGKPDVVRAGTTVPGWLPRPSEVPTLARAAGSRDATFEALRAQLGDVRKTGEEAGLLGLQIHHGTIEGFEASVAAGPKNVGKGFGGSGLYIAQGDQRELATTFAGMAEREWKGRLRELPGGFVDGPTASKGVVLSGHFDPSKAKNLRVGVFSIERDAFRPDLAAGVLPPNWADDPRLAKLLEDEFDVLAIRPKGLAIDSGEFLVVHESAGSAVVWDDAKGLAPDAEKRAVARRPVETDAPSAAAAVKPVDAAKTSDETMVHSTSEGAPQTAYRKTTLKLSEEEAYGYIAANVQGMDIDQAKLLIGKVREINPQASVVFGGSRVRGGARVVEGVVVSDMDVGFVGLTEPQIKKVKNFFNKKVHGQVIEHSWIYEGSPRDGIPDIVTPEEFFLRSGERHQTHEVFGPSGYIRVDPDNSVEVGRATAEQGVKSA